MVKSRRWASSSMRSVDVVSQDHAVLDLTITFLVIARQTAKGGHFDDLPAEMDVGQTETPSDQATIGKYLLHLIRQCIGRHIEILRFATQQQIADPTTDQIGIITGVFQPIEHLDRIFTDVGPGDGMLRAWNDDWAIDGCDPRCLTRNGTGRQTLTASPESTLPLVSMQDTPR